VVTQAQVRDWQGELTALRAALARAKDADAFAQLRSQIVAWDAPEPFKKEAKTAYNEARRQAGLT
jgi:hypothetical protein